MRVRLWDAGSRKVVVDATFSSNDRGDDRAGAHFLPVPHVTLPRGFEGIVSVDGKLATDAHVSSKLI